MSYSRMHRLDQLMTRLPANRLFFSIASLVFFGEGTIGR